jgi:hypothetical protein
MKIDELIERLDTVEAENKELRTKNIDLILQLRTLRESLESALNMLDPEQLRIIHHDVFDFNHVTIHQHA